MLVPSTFLLFSSYSKQLLSINNPSTFFSLLLTLSTALHLVSSTLLLSSYSKQLLCILVSSTRLLSSYSYHCSASLFPQLFFSLLPTLSNYSAYLFPHFFFSLLPTLSNYSTSLFPQFFFSFFLL